MSARNRPVTAAALAMAAGFNIPYALLAVLYDYPAVLRGTASDALAKFAAAGPAVILAWYGFMLAALLLVPLASALALTPQRLTERPALAIGAAISGGLAGLAQAIGLSRWVFAVPQLAASHADPATSIANREAAEQAFALLNSWGGVAIGEHLGQLLTALFVVQLASLQRREQQEMTAAAGIFTALLLLIGTGEGLAVALGHSGEAFGFVTIAGFLGLTLWLVATGLSTLRA